MERTSDEEEALAAPLGEEMEKEVVLGELALSIPAARALIMPPPLLGDMIRVLP